VIIDLRFGHLQKSKTNDFRIRKDQQHSVEADDRHAPGGILTAVSAIVRRTTIDRMIHKT